MFQKRKCVSHSQFHLKLNRLKIKRISVGTNSRASKSWIDSMVKQVLSSLQKGYPLSQSAGMSNGMVRMCCLLTKMGPVDMLSALDIFCSHLY